MTYTNIHFIGIGGIGVSGLAALTHLQGKCISGSDKEASETTEFLREKGIKVIYGHAASNIPKNAEAAVYSLAIPSTNPEIAEAKRRKIKLLSYPEAVGELTRNYFTVAVCGTHGKSTITAMLAKILIENKLDPTVIVGTKLKELDGQNFRLGKSSLFLLEACEYRRAFLNYSPRMIALHTLDPDHLDYYKDFDDYLDAFREFARKLPHDGYFFANLDDEDVHDTLQFLQREKFPPYNTFTYSTKYSNCDFYLENNKILRRGAAAGELRLKIPGAHNRTNALAAFAVAAILGVAPRDILRSLNNYEGSARRFEKKGKFGKTLFIDDYAHHPEEIKATLAAAREEFPKKKICVVFQPHQYSRTKILFKEFGTAFGDADFVVIPNIYEARDSKKDKTAISAEQLVAEIKRRNKNAIYGNGMANTTEWLRKNAKKFGVVITMGAGDIDRILLGLLRLTPEF